VLADLTADPRNRRTHNPRNVGMVIQALQAVGAARSIVIDEDDVILAGNGVTEAATAAGLTKLQIVEADGETVIAVRRRGLTPAQKRQLAMYDNRTAELAEWNLEQLAEDLKNGEDLGAFFSTNELTALLGEPPPTEGATDPEVEPELRPTTIQRGDLFALGAHRLLCGDSTQAATVARVMAGELAHLVFTDPPYGVDYTGGMKVRKRLAGDTSATLYEPAARLAATFSDSQAALYLWHADIKAGSAAAAAEGAGYEIRSVLVWYKNNAQFAAFSAHYKQKHECCYYCVKRGHAPRWYGPTNEVTVWECDRAAVNDFHPTQKPVALAERACTNSSAPGDRVLDLFLGGGSTLIACERLGRVAYGIEIDPQYVQVAIDRWEAFTGQTAVQLEAGAADARP